MRSRAQIYFFIWIYTTICSYHCSVCASRKSYIYNSEVVYYNETGCCDNYELINTTCVQCPIGFYRPVDHTPEKCIPCLKGFFGQKCAHICKCHQNESCNSLTGCVPTRGENDKSTTSNARKTITITSSTTLAKNNYILIYVACTGALALLITFAVLGRQKQRRLKLKQKKLSANRSIRLHEQNVQEDHEIINDSDRMNDTV